MPLSSQIRYCRALDSTVSTGAGKTGIAFGSFTAAYLVEGGTLISLTTETITTLGTYQAPSDATHLRIKELNSAAPTAGIYEVHFHDTQLVAAGKKLWLFLSATGAAIQPLEMELLPYGDGDATITANLNSAGTNYSATRGLAGTALPANAAGASGGLIINGSNTGTVTLAALTVTGAALFSSTFTVTGAVAFSSTFAVTTSTALGAISGSTLTLSGAVAFQSTFAVTTSTSLSALSCTTLTASGAVAFQSTFAVTGTTTLTGNVSCGGTFGVTGTVTFNALTVTNALTVSGATTLTGAVTGTNASNDLRVNGAVPGAAGGLFIAGTNAATTVTTSFTTTFTGSLTGSVGSVTTGVTVTTNNDKTGYSLTVTPPTAAAIATAVWTDTTGSDFTTSTSPGKIIFTQLGGAFTTTSSSVFSVGALANAPTGGSAPTVGQIATAVWEDLTAGGDFGTAGSIGKLIVTTGLTIAGVTGVTFPATVASPTNITAGTITTVTNLTNAPTVGDFTTDMKTSLVTAATAGTPTVTLATSQPNYAPSKAADAMTLTSAYDFAKGTVAMTEAYAANKSAPTPVQALYAIQQMLTTFAISGTAYTVKKLDGTTTAFIVTLNDGTTPTAATRS